MVTATANHRIQVPPAWHSSTATSCDARAMRRRVAFVEDAGATVEQAALQLNVSAAYVKKLIKLNKLVARQVPRDASTDSKRMRWEIEQGSIDTFLQQRQEPNHTLDATSTLQHALELSHLALQRADSMDAELVSLRRMLVAATTERDAALKQRDDQVTMSMALANDLDAARGELARVRRAQAALLAAHSALLGATDDLAVR